MGFDRRSKVQQLPLIISTSSCPVGPASSFDRHWFKKMPFLSPARCAAEHAEAQHHHCPTGGLRDSRERSRVDVIDAGIEILAIRCLPMEAGDGVRGINPSKSQVGAVV